MFVAAVIDDHDKFRYRAFPHDGIGQTLLRICRGTGFPDIRQSEFVFVDRDDGDGNAVFFRASCAISFLNIDTRTAVRDVFSVQI